MQDVFSKKQQMVFIQVLTCPVLWLPRHIIEYGSKHQKTNIQQDRVKENT